MMCAPLALMRAAPFDKAITTMMAIGRFDQCVIHLVSWQGESGSSYPTRASGNERSRARRRPSKYPALRQSLMEDVFLCRGLPVAVAPARRAARSRRHTANGRKLGRQYSRARLAYTR